MQDWYLKAADEAAMTSALVSAGVLSDQGLAPGLSLDVIGVMTLPTGETRVLDGIPYAVTAPLPGWHANLRGELSGGQMRSLSGVLLVVEPKTPWRAWA